MTQPFPTEKAEWANPDAEQAFSLLQSAISTVRTARALLNISTAQTPLIHGRSIRDQDIAPLTKLKPYIQSLLCSELETSNILLPLRTLELPCGHFYTIGIQVPKDIDLKQVIKKIQKQIGEKEKEIQRLDSRLASPEFREKAESSVIQDSEDRRAKIQDELNLLTITDQQLTSMISW